MPENTTAVGSAAAPDPDKDDTAVTYALRGTDADLFSISAVGDIAFVVAPDFENPQGGSAGDSNDYALTVFVTGGADARAMTATRDIAASVSGSALTLTPDAAGRATVTVTVTGGDGELSAVQSFSAAVRAAAGSVTVAPTAPAPGETDGGYEFALT